MGNEVKWVKLNSNMFNNEKLRLLESKQDGDKNVLLWIKLLMLAGKINRNGVVFRFETDKYFKQSKEETTKFFERCFLLGMVDFYMKGSVNESVHIIEPEQWYKVDRQCVLTDGNWQVKRIYILERDNYTCQYCGKDVGTLEVDHVIPRCKGGLSTEDNLVCACFNCNRSKGGRTPEEWRCS